MAFLPILSDKVRTNCSSVATFAQSLLSILANSALFMTSALDVAAAVVAVVAAAVVAFSR